MKIKWKEIPLTYRIVAIALVCIAVFTITFQTISIHKIKETQKEQFYGHIASAANGLEEYKETGYAFLYEDALMELHSASSIALLLKDDDAYKGMHNVLLSIVGTYHTFPEDLALFNDDLIDVLNNFSIHHDVENLYTKLNSIDNRLEAMLADRLEKVE